MEINLDLYAVFCRVAQKQSITLAAQELFISQPAVSQSIRQLEARLGCCLFGRTPKGVILSAEGLALYDYVSRGIELIEQGELALRRMTAMDEGLICIGASDMTLEFCLLPYLERFKEEHPRIKITVSNAPTPDTLELLRTGKIDFGAVSLPISDSSDLDLHPINEIEDIFVAGSRFEHLRGKSLSPEELCALPLICLEKNTSTRSYVDGFLEQWGQRLEPELELATANLIAQFAARNLGVGSIVDCFSEPLIKSGELFKLTLLHPIPKRHLCIVMQKKRPLSVAAANLLSMII